jgi:DNA-binding NarL/FixJ family response regulator
MRYSDSGPVSIPIRVVWTGGLGKGGSLGPSKIGVLVVDDFDPFREMISSILEEMPDVKVIGQASDGLEAVQKAEQLKPDLILLDIGLPKLDGIEAARRIRSISPEAKIIFVSQNVSSVPEALSTGARGYVIKADVANEIMTAVDAVMRGEKFVSSALQDEGLI